MLLAGWVPPLSAGQPASIDDASAQEQVIQLLQRVIQDSWRSSGLKSAGLTNKPDLSTNVEAAFRKASELMPHRLDLRFGIASSLVIQAAQTNGAQLDRKLKQALSEYREIQSLDPQGFAAPILYAAYARVLGETNASNEAVRGLMVLHPESTTLYLEKFRGIDQILQLSPPETARRLLPRNEKIAIVVLGAGLQTNGTMKPKLVARLKQGLKLARLYPRAPLIVTGGNPKGGITEAYAMSLWYRHRGISRKRLILEDQARDTIENAVYSSAILQRLQVNQVILVTSSSHIRRGLADLQEACLQRGLTVQYQTLATKTGDTVLDRTRERLGIYRDVLRLSGLWDFPGLQR